MSKYESALNRLDAELHQLLDSVSSLDNHQLNALPAPGQWSIGQVLNHVMLSEKLSHQYIKKKLSFNPRLPKARLRSKLRGWLLNVFLRSPIKIKAAKGVRTENLPKSAEMQLIKRQWLTQRQALRSYLFTLDSKWDGCEIYKHPLVGRISLPQMLTFFRGHLARHRKQIERILARM